MGRLAVRLALPPHRLFVHHRHSGPIHLHIQDGNGLVHHHRQVQLHGPLDLFLLPRSDIVSDGFRGPLHGLRGHLQTGE